MEVTFHGFGKDDTAGLERYARVKMQKLEGILPQVIDAACEIYERNLANPERVFRVQMTMHVRGRILRSEVKGRNVTAAVDAATHKMERQIDRFKGRKRKDRRSPRDAEALPTTDAAAAADAAYEAELWGEEGYIVREKEFGVTAMAVEEAVEVMELLEHDFHVFLNRESQSLNVVYRRARGNYGLLKPRLPAA